MICRDQLIRSQKILDVIPSNMGGMRFEARSDVAGHQVSQVVPAKPSEAVDCCLQMHNPNLYENH